MSFDKAYDYAQRLMPDERLRFWDFQNSPPDVRGRRREARHWRMLMRALTFTPTCLQRQPADGDLSLAEKYAIWTEADRRLKERDPELAAALRRIQWEITNREVGLPLDIWKRRVARESIIIGQLQAELRRHGPYPLPRERMFAILGVPSGRNFPSSAEVAERQTR